MIVKLPVTLTSPEIVPPVELNLVLANAYAELAYELAALAEFLAKPSVEEPPDNALAKS